MIPTHNLLLVSSLKFIRNASRDPNRIDIYTCLKLNIQKMNIYCLHNQKEAVNLETEKYYCGHNGREY